jgi:CDP-glycerol glycerophosphotransferase
MAAARLDGAISDGIISECGVQSEEFRACFWLNENTQILEIGLPRNDKLFDKEQVHKTALHVRNSLGVGANQGIVLYMPTFRDDHSMDGYRLDFDGVLSAFERRFGRGFVILVRLHPNVQGQAGFIQYNDHVINATCYPDAQELYMAADYLITDYSSAAFDFALLQRPVFLCTLDYEKYRGDRGLTNVFHQCPFPKACDNDQLIRQIEAFSREKYDAQVNEFRRFWHPYDRGDAAKRAADWLTAK